MEERNDWEKLNTIIDGYEPDPDLARAVIEKINQRESTVAYKKAPDRHAVLAAGIFGLVIVVFLAIFLPLYLTRNRVRIILYGAEDVEVYAISDMDSVVRENDLDINYFSDGMTVNYVAKIKESNDIAYIMQDCFVVSENGIDNVNLKVVVMKNAEFDFYDTFKKNNSFLDVDNIRVDYNIDSDSAINAKFKYQNNSYFLEIKTSNDGTQAIEKYVNMLIGK